MQNLDKTFWKAILLLGFILFIYLFFISPPYNFSEGKILTIKSGSLSQIAKELKLNKIIRSETVFKSFTIFFGGEKKISPGDYKFEKKISVWRVAQRISKGEHHVAQIKITIPEGFTDKEIALLVSSKFPNILKDSFLSYLAKKQTNIYPLFPETYFFFPSFNLEDIIGVMNDTYLNKIRPLKAEIASSVMSEMQIMTMASIIEKESKNSEEKPIIAGILWKRMKKGMLLQVDAAPETYKYKGLPVSPICEPGLDSILAALRPVDSPYFFYLHDRDGIIHYAKIFSEHNKNRQKYLLP